MGEEFAEEREGRVRDHDVRLFQERDALGAAEIATWVLPICLQGHPSGLVPLEENLDVGHVRSAVSVLVFYTVEDDGQRLGLLSFAVTLVVFREQGALAGD